MLLKQASTPLSDRLEEPAEEAGIVDGLDNEDNCRHDENNDDKSL
jgi:hypothetical protein